MNSFGIFPGNVRSKFTELILGEFSSGSPLRDFVQGIFGPSVIRSVNGKAFSVMEPKSCNLIRLEYFLVMIWSRMAGNNSLRIFFRSVRERCSIVGLLHLLMSEDFQGLLSFQVITMVSANLLRTTRALRSFGELSSTLKSLLVGQGLLDNPM